MAPVSAGTLFINAPNSWQYCLPRLDEVYANCGFLAKQMDSCNIWSIAQQMGISLPRPSGSSAAETAALPPWDGQQG